MRNVIPFPKSVRKNQPLKVDKAVNPSDLLIIKDFEFTCPNCKTISKFEQSNMFFKIIKFYCGGCGNPHTVVNPALKDR